MASGPSVAIVVVDHDGGEMTLACLRAIAATQWSGPPLRIVLVDNSPTHPLTAAQLASVPLLRAADVLRPEHNVGFPAAVNLALDHLHAGSAGGPDHVALVNNDAFVEPGWLQPLVAALEVDAGLGAVQGKLLFEPAFVPVIIEAPLVTRRRGPAIGVRVDGPPGTVHSTGFSAVRPGEWWTTEPSALVFVAAAPADTQASISLQAQRPSSAVIDGREIAVGPEPTQVSVPLPTDRVDVVQNAGNEITTNWWVRDRGAGRADGPPFDEGHAIWGWCGGLVLLRSAYLADVGRMDGRFFLYWEDVDLAWRGARRGWRYRYVPASVARHRHGASLGQGSALFSLLNQRNRLVVLARHAGPTVAMAAWARTFAEAGWFVWTDVVAAMARRTRPSWQRTSLRVRALAGAVPLLVRGPPRR